MQLPSVQGYGQFCQAYVKRCSHIPEGWEASIFVGFVIGVCFWFWTDICHFMHLFSLFTYFQGIQGEVGGPGRNGAPGLQGSIGPVGIGGERGDAVSTNRSTMHLT